MKVLVWVLAVILGVVVLWWGMQVIASETGEVVVVTTQRADGSSHDTRLWVVDYDGAPWLRAGSSGAGWFQDMLANPTVVVLRDDVRATYEIDPQPAAIEPINQAMRDKYGWRDAYVSLFFSRDDAVPIRLVAE